MYIYIYFPNNNNNYNNNNNNNPNNKNNNNNNLCWLWQEKFFILTKNSLSMGSRPAWIATTNCCRRRANFKGQQAELEASRPLLNRPEEHLAKGATDYMAIFAKGMAGMYSFFLLSSQHYFLFLSTPITLLPPPLLLDSSSTPPPPLLLHSSSTGRKFCMLAGGTVD